MQSELLELLDPGLLDAMHGSPMLLPHSVHQHQRPFWVLSNIAEDMDMARLVELIHQYDTEVRAAALAQGNEPPPHILPMINIIAVLPAGLMLLPPPNPMEYSRRTTPPRTNAYLLLPRAGAIILSPVPSSACIEQAGPWRTPAVFEVREDGYLMEDIRTLARSGRGAAAAASIPHPRMVNLAEYTEANAIASIHGDLATALYEEPTSINAPMHRPGAPPPPPPPNNPWTGHRSNHPSPGHQHGTQDSTASPLSSHSSSASPHHSMDSQAQGQQDSTTTPVSSSREPTSRTDTQEPNGNEPPPPAWWFSHMAYQSDPSESDSDTGEKEGEVADMDTTQPLPTDPPFTQPVQEPIPQASPASIKELIEAAIQEAQRAAREEYQKELAQMTLRHQRETQAIRTEFQQGTQSLREDIIMHAQQTAQLQQQQTADLQRI